MPQISEANLSVIVPYFNEEATVHEIVSQLCRLDMVAEVIAVDDGSTDTSFERLQNFAHSKLRHFRLSSNQGKAAAVELGIRMASQPWILIQDADLEYNPKDIPRLWHAARGQNTSVVFGSRFLTGHRKGSKSHVLANRVITRLSNLVNKSQITDLETGYKCFRSELVDGYQFRSRGFGLEVELGSLLNQAHGGIVEIPISYDPRDRAQGKKIRFKGWGHGLMVYS